MTNSMVCCKNELNLNRLCVQDCIVGGELHCECIKTKCVNTNDLCAVRGVINKLCVNDLTVGSLNKCEKWRAAVQFAADTTYTLGSVINFDTVIDDPNANVTLSPFSYTVPVSGYYDLSAFMLTSGLFGSSTISGTPISELTIKVNGVDARKVLSPYISFSSLQSAILDSLFVFNAGDVITLSFNVFILDSVLGLIPFVGTTLIKSSSVKSGLIVHYLSSLECTPVICAACPEVV